jgi:hypothetical protein
MDGWRLKAYGISGRRELPPPAFVDAARDLAQRELPTPAEAPERYGVGFVGVHEGRDGDLYAFVDWWENENELCHRQYVGSNDLQPSDPIGIRACVWDLAVVAFERQAWLDAVLQNLDGPDLDRYLATRLEGEV